MRLFELLLRRVGFLTLEESLMLEDELYEAKARLNNSLKKLALALDQCRDLRLKVAKSEETIEWLNALVKNLQAERLTTQEPL